MKKLCLLLVVIFAVLCTAPAVLAAAVESAPAAVTDVRGDSTNTAAAAPARGEPVSSSAPLPQPKVIVSSYQVTPSPVVAGEAFTVSVILRNTSTAQAVRNMTVTVSTDAKSFESKNDSDTFYIRTLAAGGTTQLKLKYTADQVTPEQRYNITLNLAYENSQAMNLSSVGVLEVEVSQPQRMQLEVPAIAETVNAGDTLPLSLNVMNLGKSKVYNVRCTLVGAGLIPTGTAFIGNMEPGTASAGQMNVFIGTKDMSSGSSSSSTPKGSEKYGATDGTITMTYEDASGKEYKTTAKISTIIDEPIIAAVSSSQAEGTESAGQWWVSILVVGVLAVGLALALIIRKKRGVS